MIVAKRTIRVVRLDDDNFSFVVGKLDGFAVDVGAGKIRRRLADFHGEGGSGNHHGGD